MFASLFLKRAKKETLSILFERSQSSPQTGYGSYMYVLFFFLAMLHSMWDLSSQRGMEPTPPLRLQSLNPGTAS